MDEYEESLKTYRDLKGVIDTSFDEGKEIGLKEGEEIGIKRGIEKGLMQTALSLKKQGFSPEMIAKTTGLALDKIDQL